MFHRRVLPGGRASSAALIATVWTAMAALANPVGDFPQNDDWAYGWSVKMLLETGSLQFSDWAATNLVPQIFWGALFSLPFGFSFTALRLSSLAAGLIGLLATHGLLRELGAGRQLSLICVALVGLNPLYFALSNSFNTDVPSFALLASALYLLARGLRQPSRRLVLAGLAVSLVSVLERQSNIVVLPAFGLAYLLTRPVTPATVAKALVPTALGIGLQASFALWLDAGGRTPLLYGFQSYQLMRTLSAGPGTIASTYGTNLAVMATYLGLFLFPVLVLDFSSRMRRFSTTAVVMWLGSLSVLVATALVMLGDRRMPFAHNILESGGIGPQQLDGFYSSVGGVFRSLEAGIWHVLTAVGIVGAAVIGYYVTIAIRQLLAHRGDRRPVTALMLCTACLYFAGIGGLPPDFWFDRYLLPFLVVLPALVVLQAEAVIRPERATASPIGVIATAACVTTLAVSGVFAVVATHDNLASNRARWAGLRELMQSRGVQAAEIKGGWDFGGWYFGQRIETCHPDFDRRTVRQPTWDDFACLWNNGLWRRNPWDVETWEWRYTVSYELPSGQTAETTRQFRRWLPWQTRTVFVLRRSAIGSG